MSKVWADGVWKPGLWREGLWADGETPPSDTTPDPFSFVDQIGVALEGVITSAPITVTGINAAAAITVTGGEYSINGGAFTSDPGTVNNGDEVRARHTASDEYLTDTDTVVTIGGVSDTFTSKTRSQPAVGGIGIHAQPRLGGIMVFG